MSTSNLTSRRHSARPNSKFSAIVFASLSLSNALLIMALPIRLNDQGNVNSWNNRIDGTAGRSANANTVNRDRAPPRKRINFNGGTGDGTFYGVGVGACGQTSSPQDRIAAVSHELFDAYAAKDGANTEAVQNPNKNPICGKQINVTYKDKSTTVTVVDRCAGCNGTYDLDFSPRAFDDLADESVGRIHGMEWRFVNAGDTGGSGGQPATGHDGSGAGGKSKGKGKGQGETTSPNSSSSSSSSTGSSATSTSSSSSPATPPSTSPSSDTTSSNSSSSTGSSATSTSSSSSLATPSSTSPSSDSSPSSTGTVNGSSSHPDSNWAISSRPRQFPGSGCLTGSLGWAPVLFISFVIWIHVS